jgi:hypothetical protein
MCIIQEAQFIFNQGEMSQDSLQLQVFANFPC